MLKIIGNTNYLIPKSEKNVVIENFSKLLRVPINYDNPRLPYVNVVSMGRQDLYSVQNKYIVSDKIDGERSLLFITNGKGYVLTMDNKLLYTGFTVDKKFDNSVLDGEYVFNSKYKKFVFIVFDCLFVSGKDYRWDKSLINRVLKGNELVNNCFLGKCKFKSYDYNHKAKDQEDLLKFYKSYILEYQEMLNDNLKTIEDNQILIRHGLFLDIRGYSNNEVFKYADLMWKMYNQNTQKYVYKSDGIIFHPKNANYNNVDIQEQKVQLLKWKPVNRNTIDFYIEFERNPLTHKIEEVYDFSQSKKIKESNNSDNTANIDNEETDTGKSGKYKICKLYVSKQIDKLTKPVIFNPKLNNNGDIHIVYLPIVNGAIKDLSGNIITDKTVVEFYYNIDGNTENYHFNWIPVKTRYDKTLIMRLNKIKYGNADVVAYNIWNSINYPIRESDLSLLSNDKIFSNEVEKLVRSVQNINTKVISETQLSEMKNQKIYNDLDLYNRNFYNMVKTILCNTYLSDKFDNTKKSILDIGIGYGYDIFKYYDAEVKDMVCIDIDYNKFTHPTMGAIQRLENAKLKYPAFPHTDFINASIIKPFTIEDQETIIQNNSKENKELIDKFLTGKNKFDCVQCFNVLNEVLADDNTLKIICDNFNKVIKKNGILILITLNKDLVDKKLKDDKFTLTYFINNQNLTIYEINKNEENKHYESVTILTPSENINPIPHYLIDEDYLIEQLDKQCKLKLIENDNFENIFNNMKDYIEISSQIDSELKTRKFFNDKILKFYEDTEINKKNQEIIFLYSYYVFIKV